MRLFVAVRPPREALEHLAAALGRDVDDRWHVTVAFLGEADPVDLSEVAAKHAALTLRLAGLARFGRAVGARVEGDVPALQDLAAATRKACRRQGVAVERRTYRPHLTVQRGETPTGLRGYAGPTWRVTELELVRSTLGRPAARHEVIRRWPLGLPGADAVAG